MKNGIVFQNGLKDVTGHVDVFYNEVSGGAAYTYYNDKKNYPNTSNVFTTDYYSIFYR